MAVSLSFSKFLLVRVVNVFDELIWKYVAGCF